MSNTTALFKNARSWHQDDLTKIAAAVGSRDPDITSILDAARQREAVITELRETVADLRRQIQGGSKHCRACRWYRPWCAYGQAGHVAEGVGCSCWEIG